jgi:hypothetical protein
VSSTIQNLQFLEAQLDQYLHSHEDDGTTLWVTPQGMRMPYKKTKDNLEENMKFVEAQLEKYLHEHETAGGSTANEMPTYNDADDTFGGILGDDSPNSVRRRAQGFTIGVGAVISTVDLRIARAELTNPIENDSVIVEIHTGASPASSTNQSTSDPVTVASMPLRTIPNDGDPMWDMVTFTFQSPYTIQSSNVHFLVIRRTVTGNTSSDHRPEVHTRTTNPYAGGSSWLQNASGWTEISSGAHDIGFAINGDSTLYTTPAGFRFPYGWANEGHLRHNMKFLELEISKYLHKHEEGT